MKLGKRQVKLAKLLGLSQQSISRKLRGEIEWRVSELVRIAKEYEVTVTDLLEGNDA
jgi:transcriptional regulator with XRE-family HTH domain